MGDIRENIHEIDPVEEFVETSKSDFVMKIGGTFFDVSTHFNPDGRQCVLDQFKRLILDRTIDSLKEAR